MFRESLEELKKTRTITICGLFAAMSCLMGSFTIRIGNILKIGFSGLINELVSMFFGPVVGGVFGGMTDVLKYILRPDGAFLIGMTLNSALAGVIYGIFLYKKKISFWRILAAGVVVGFLCNIIITTWLLVPLTGKGFFVMLPTRLLKNVVMIPINALIFYLLQQGLVTAKVHRADRKSVV